VNFEPNIPAKVWKNTKGKLELGDVQKIDAKFTANSFIPAKETHGYQYTFWLDLSPNLDEMMAAQHSKTRYNIRLAKRKGVVVTEETSEAGLSEFLKLHALTTKRQNYFMHDAPYFERLWKHFGPDGANWIRILVAREGGDVLNVWIMFVWGDTMYYPYGASGDVKRNLMAPNLTAWKAIELAKSLGLKRLDFWGAEAHDVESDNRWYGFHKFKLGYGGDLVWLGGSWDLVTKNRLLYEGFWAVNRARWFILRRGG